MRIQHLRHLTLKLTAIVALGAIISACGGGRGTALDDLNNGGGGGGGGGTGNQLAQIGTGTGANFQAGVIGVGIGDNTLSAGGSTLLSVTVVNNGELITDSVSVSFNSPCFASGTAMLSPQAGASDGDSSSNVVETTNGQATIRYIASGCVGQDVVKATTSYGGSVISAEAVIDVAADTVTSLSFIDATPSLITLKGSGGAETSILRFRVRGSTGAPVNGVIVNFALSRTSGGLQLANDSDTSDVDGYVYTTVQSGTVPGPVQVTATTEGGISTMSGALVLSSGLPDQNSFSISATDIAPNSWGIDGVISTITIRAADAFNNPAPIGTPIYFTTNGGAIAGECFIQADEDFPNTSSGACSVNWRSQNPKPQSDVSFIVDEAALTINCPAGVAECRDGRLKIVATTLGNESFIDTNGNGQYDPGTDEFYTATSTEGNTAARQVNCRANQPVSGLESRPTSGSISNAYGCDDLGDPYVDHNFNRRYDNGEEIATIQDQADNQYNSANGIYNGVLCRQADADDGLCSREPVLVRADMTLVMSSHRPLFMADGGLPGQPNIISLRAGETRSFTMILADENGNGIPAGTETAAYDEAAQNVEVIVSPEGEWPSSQEPGYITIFVTADEERPSGAVGVDITVPGPDGGEIIYTVLIPVGGIGF